MPFKTSERKKRDSHTAQPAADAESPSAPAAGATAEEAPEAIVRAKQYEASPEPPEDSAAPQDAPSPKVAVILGSKGVEAFASLPLLNILDKSGIHVDLVVGCSGGGVMAALWGSGYNLKQIQQFFSHFFTKETFALPDAEELIRLANDNYNPRGGIYNTASQFKAYEQIFKDARIEDLAPRTIFHATDIRTGEGVTISKGPITSAIQACGALYPIMAPVEIDGRLLADGSYTMPLPVIEAVRRNMDLILVSFTDAVLDPNPDTLLASFININRITTNALRKAQFFSSVDMHTYEICFAPVPLRQAHYPWDVQHIPAIVSAGKQAALDAMPEFLKMYADFSRCPQPSGPEPDASAGDSPAPAPEPEQEPASFPHKRNS